MNERIEFVSCPLEGSNCKEHRMVINRNYYASQDYLQNKDYSRAIIELKNAFHKTSDLQKTTCLNCAELFRETIIQSLANIHDDLFKMSKGVFSTKRFNSSIELAGNILKEIKKEG